MKPARFTVLFIFFLYYSATAVAQQVHTYVGIDSLQVGDEFDYTIVFDGNYQSIQFPNQDAFEEDLTVKSIQRYQSEAGRDSIVYKLQFFAIEDLTISSKDISVQTEAGDSTYTTTPVPLFFKTSLAAEDDNFRPMKPIFDFARAWWPWIVGLIVLLIAGYYGYRRYQTREVIEEPKPDEPPPPFSSPLDELKETISGLSDVEYLETEEQFERFYVELGDAIRRYIKRVYEFQALEMTTSEITMTLQEEHAPPKLISITRKVLNEADIVKFANFNPGTDGARSAWESAQKFIETAEVVNYEQLEYMKYKYEVRHGIVKGEIKQTTEEQS